jgi:hypothetical protein
LGRHRASRGRVKTVLIIVTDDIARGWLTD